MNKILILLLSLVLIGCGTTTKVNTIDTYGDSWDTSKAIRSYRQDTASVTSNTNSILVQSSPIEIPPFHIENGIVYLTVDQLLNEGINKASEWCSRSGACRYINVPFGTHDVKYNIILQSETRLTATKGTVLNLYPSNPDTAAVYFDAAKRNYVNDVEIWNIDFQLMSPATSVIQTNNALRGKIIYCNIDANKLSQYGLVLDGTDKVGSIDTEVHNTIVREAKDAGIMIFKTGGKHRFTNCFVRLNGTGLKGHANRLILDACAIEHNDDGVNIELTSGISANLTNCSFEKGDIKVSNVDIFTFENGNRISGGNFIFDNVGYTSLKGSILNGCTVSTVDRIAIEGNMWQTLFYDNFLKSNCDNSNTIKDNFNGREGYLKDCNK